MFLTCHFGILFGSHRKNLNLTFSSSSAMFDNPATSKDQLSFKKDDILYITDTLYNGHLGSWKAWIVNKEDAQQRESGMVPSRMK
jgi:hypothetical protein